MGKAVRLRPKRLGEKLKAIRLKLDYSQTEMLMALGYESYKKELRSVISAYERDKREPNLIDLLSYARIAKVTVEEIIDDELELLLFR
jgi:transcriptional regulator with XRE-family HTH domain